MPVAHFHLSRDAHEGEAVSALLVRASVVYADVLQCPLDRVRAYAVEYDPLRIAVAGVPGTQSAPYFTAIVLAGRPEEQRRRLLSALTDTVVDTLDVDRALVRGRIVQVNPEDWGIGGRPAAEVRAGEIRGRAEQH